MRVELLLHITTGQAKDEVRQTVNQTDKVPVSWNRPEWINDSSCQVTSSFSWLCLSCCGMSYKKIRHVRGLYTSTLVTLSSISSPLFVFDEVSVKKLESTALNPSQYGRNDPYAILLCYRL